MSFSTDHLTDVLTSYRDRERWVVGFSGGLDSTVLLEASRRALQQFDEGRRPELHALHINHQMHRDATTWAAHCERFCSERGIAFKSVAVAIDRPGTGPEGAARAARYRAFEAELHDGDLLLLAHHRDDQVETVLLHLLRGSGTLGLAGMPASRPLARAGVLRPLLAFSRADLLAWAQKLELDWVEDDSNRDTALSRNFLRQRVLPLLREHWPAADNSIADTADVLRDEHGLIDEVAREDFARCSHVCDGNTVIGIAALLSLSPPRRTNVLRHWLARFVLQPRRTQLRQIFDTLLAAGEDRQPVVSIGAYDLRRHDGGLYCIRRYPVPEPFDWDPAVQPEIPGWGRLVAQYGDVGGLRPATDYRVAFRCGGERAHPVERDHSTTLKKLFQEFAVPEWERERWPLLYHGDALAAVPGLFVCRDFAVTGDAPGWFLRRVPINCAPF